MEIPATLVVLVLFGGIHLFREFVGFGWMSIVADMSPFAFFMYSLWVLVRNVTGYTLLFVALAYILGRRSRWLLLLAFCFVLIVEISSTYVAHVFHASLASEWLPLLLNTSVDEVIQFLRMSATLPMIFGLALTIGFLVLVGRVILRARYPRSGFRSLAVGFLLLVPFVLFNCLLMNWHFGVNQTAWTSFIFGGLKSWTEGRGIRSACLTPNLPPRVQTSVASGELPDLVFVLGESATRNSWHLFGYPRQTTPRMDAVCRGGGGYGYDNVLGIVPVTDRALALLLTDVKFDNPMVGNWTIAEVFKRAGYECVLISNQGGGQSGTSTLERIFNGCNRRINLDRECRGTAFDGEALPLLARELSDGEQAKAIFIHLKGMHFPVQNAVPDVEKHYTDDVESACLVGLSAEKKDRINRYDDAIRYEDKVLGEIVDVLAKRAKPSCMFFISDHGESPRTEGWRIYTDLDIYEVPMVIWMSPQYHAKFPDVAAKVAAAQHKPLQSDELTHGLLELGCITDIPGVTEKMSFLSPDFKGRSPRLADKGRIVYKERSRP